MSARGAQKTGLQHVGALDGLRAVAAYGVIATHAGFNSGRSLDDGPFAPMLARLDFGVTLFFLLSGYLLFRPFAAAAIAEQPGPDVTSFWWRRFLRIAPAYWIAVAVTLGFLSSRPASADDWWSYLLLMQTYNGHNVDPSLTQMWTLAVEIAFYALLPLTAVLTRRLSRGAELTGQLCLVAVFAATALGTNLWAHARSGDAAVELLWLPTYLDWFGLGMFLAIASCLSGERSRWRRVLGEWARVPGTCWVGGALLFWLSTLPLCGPRNLFPASAWQWTTKHYLYGAAAFLFLLPLALGDEHWAQRLLGSRIARWLGEISYGVYLWHLGLLLAIQRWLGWPTFGGHFVVLFTLTAVAATIIAALSWHVIERPILRRFGRSWRSPSQRRGDQEQRQGDKTEQLHAPGAGERTG